MEVYRNEFVGVDMDRCLAPFIDVNCNGIYDPIRDGDYPLMPGAEFGRGADQMIWWVSNDDGNNGNRTLGGRVAPSIGMEIQYEAFAYATSDAVNNMTFYRQKLINRGSRRIRLLLLRAICRSRSGRFF